MKAVTSWPAWSADSTATVPTLPAAPKTMTFNAISKTSCEGKGLIQLCSYVCSPSPTDAKVRTRSHVIVVRPASPYFLSPAGTGCYSSGLQILAFLSKTSTNLPSTHKLIDYIYMLAFTNCARVWCSVYCTTMGHILQL